MPVLAQASGTAGALERVEILRGPSSVLYGQGPVAGVVNLILKRNIEGIEGTIQYNVSELGDNDQTTLELAAGHEYLDGRLRVMVAGEISDLEGIADGGTRDWGRVQRAYILNPTYTTTNGQYRLLPSDNATFSRMTVTENVQTAIAAQRRRTLAAWPPARRLFREEAMAVIENVGMADSADRACGLLAYGDIKRVELAIALAGDPKLLLMDEPTAGMGTQERSSMMELTERLARERAIGVLFTEHDMDAVFSHADRIFVLVRGEIIAHGSPDEIQRNERVKEVYLGESGLAAAEQALKVTS
jgi:ABC-type lipopolysaccharide export system ATPase subunit